MPESSVMTFADMMQSVFGEQTAAAISGAAGGAVRWMTVRQGWRDGLISVVVGSICSIYLSPLVEPMIDASLGKVIASEAKRAGLAGFIIGVGGILVSGFIIDFWKIRRGQLQAGIPQGQRE